MNMKNMKTYLALTSLAVLLAACGGEKRHKNQAQHLEDKTPAKQTVAAQQSCHATNPAEIAGLFDKWNDALKSGKPSNVVALYAKDSILLPTLSNKVRYSAAEKDDYFQHFLENSPVGVINERYIQIGCDTAFDAGVYTFNFAKTGNSATGRYTFTYKWDGKQWLISSHHSSLMPEKTEKSDKPEEKQEEAKTEKSVEVTEAVKEAQPVVVEEKPAPAPAPEHHAMPPMPVPNKDGVQPIVIYVEPSKEPQVIHIMPKNPAPAPHDAPQAQAASQPAVH